MRGATQYKTSFGLYQATIRALETLDGCKRGWWLQNAVSHAEAVTGLNDSALAIQLRNLIGQASPQIASQLQARN